MSATANCKTMGLKFAVRANDPRELLREMSGAEKLYTPQLLALAIKLADYPWDYSLPHQGDARSKSCGSTIALGLGLDSDGAIAALGMRVRACAVGQASAAIFADHAKGKDVEAISAMLAALTLWLNEDGPLPDWPGLAVIEPARAFPARHGAIRLPWDAAFAALSTAPLNV